MLPTQAANGWSWKAALTLLYDDTIWGVSLMSLEEIDLSKFTGTSSLP